MRGRWMKMTEAENKQIAIAALRCDGQLREALQTYESEFPF